MSKKVLILLFIIFLIILSPSTTCKKMSFFLLNINDLNEDVKKMDDFKALKLKKSSDTSNSTINYFDIDSFDSSAFQIKEDDSSFKVVDYGPVGELPVEMKHPTIYIMFSHPVVPIGKLGDVMTESNIIEVKPKVKGIYRWYGTKLLSFEPSEKYLPQRKYLVIINKDTKSLGGKKIEGNRKFNFNTEYLDIADFFPGKKYGAYSLRDVPLPEAKKITISFTYPVNIDVIKKYIKVTSRSKNYKYSIKRPKKEKGLPDNFIDRTIILYVDDDFKEDSEVQVTLQKGARSEEEFIGRPTKIVKSFHTLTPFKYSYYDTYSWSFPRSDKGDVNPVYIVFSHPVDKDSIIGNMEISLPVTDLEENIEVWEKTIKINNLPVKFESTYYVRIDTGIKDIYGRNLTEGQFVKINVPAAASYYYFPNSGTKMLEAQYAPKIIYEHQNIFDGVWKIDKINDPYRKFEERELGPYDFSYAKKNVKHYKILDLTPWLDNGKGFVGLSWNFAEKNNKGIRPYWSKKDLMLQVTDLGVTTRYAYNKILVYVNSLSTGLPVRNANVNIKRGSSQIKFSGKTDKNGLAIFEIENDQFHTLFSTKYEYRMRIRVEKNGDKIEFLPNQSHNPYHFGIWSTSNPHYIHKTRAQTFIFTDRGLYKPGETLTFRGIDRDLKLGEYSIYEGSYNISVRENKYKSKPFYTTSGYTTESGGFYGSFVVPENTDPGYYLIEYQRGNNKKSISFQVAHFRRLNFAVRISKPDITYFTGDTISMKIGANYLAGGALSGGKYNYYWTKNYVYFKPKGSRWKSYRFGPDKYDHTQNLSSDEGKLNALGELTAKQKTEEGIKGLTYKYNLETRIEDIDRQLVSGRRSITVHPSSFYIGAKLNTGDEGWWSPFVKKGDKVGVNYAIVRPNGELYDAFKKSDKLDVKLYHITWKVTKQQGVYGRLNMRYEKVEELEYEKKINLKSSIGYLSITPKEAGSYFLEFESMDNDGRSAVTRLSFYSTGSSWVRWRQEGDVDINLIADKNIYKPGETARLLVQSPLPRGKYLLTVEREGILDEKIIELEGSANTIEIPIDEKYLPIFYVAISSFSKRENDPPKSYFEPDMSKPKGYFGITSLKVSTESRELDIEIIPSKGSYLPGNYAEVTIKATKSGVPVPNTEITFMAADRGVLDLINYHVPNPIDFFYATDKFPLGVYGADSRSLLIDPITYEMKDLPGGGGDDDKMKKRKDFRPTAVFKPYLKTDKNGIVKIKFKLPDTLTTYRCTAVAVKKNLFGINENEIMVQNPINVRTALPRRLRVRDTSFAGVIITNLDSAEQKVSVSIDSDIIQIDGENKRTVTVPPNSSIEVPFKLLAVKTGEATLVFRIISSLLTEELEGKLVVEKPLVKEAFTTTGKTAAENININDKAQEGIIIPSNIAEGYGGITITLDSTRLASLSESIFYLFNYPYGCIEQRTSRLLPLVIFGDKIIPFGLDSSVSNVKGTIEKEIAYIAKFQNSDGGFPFWLEEGGRSSNYGSLKLAHILHFAFKNGYKVPKNLDLKKLLKFIEGLPDSKYVSRYCKIYSLYVRSLFGDNVVIKAEDFYKDGDKNGLSGYGFLGLAFYNNGKKERAKEALTRMKNFMKVGTQTIDLVETYKSRFYFDSDVTNLALLLMLFDELDPKSDFIEKITNTLMKRQNHGYWVNTSDTAWALQALSQVFEGEAGTETNFTAEVKLNKTNLLKVPFKGVSKNSVVRDYNFDDDPLNNISKNKLFPLDFIKTGKGTLFYTTTIRYALPSEVVPARDEGFGIFTEITDMDGNKVEGRYLDLGETYRMRAVISTSKRRNYVAARLPIPSGAEILDASFVTTASYNEKGGTSSRRIERETVYGDEYGFEDEGYGGYDGYNYYMYSIKPIQKIMDNEVIYFFDDFYAGKQEVTFLFRATTPGIYPTPPAYVECMYEEEVFGRNDGKLYIIRE